MIFNVDPPLFFLFVEHVLMQWFLIFPNFVVNVRYLLTTKIWSINLFIIAIYCALNLCILFSVKVKAQSHFSRSMQNHSQS